MKDKEELKNFLEFSKDCLPIINKILEKEGIDPIDTIDETDLKNALLYFFMTHKVETKL